MAERGTGMITVGGITTGFRAPTRPQEAVMPQQAEDPNITRLKKFYTEQYNIEAGGFAKQARNQEEFDRGMSNLQTKYRMAFNQAKVRMDQPEPAFRQWSELELYRNKIESRLANYKWSGKPGKTKLEVWNPYEGKEGEFTSKGITTKQREEAINLTLERNRVRALQQSILSPGVTSNLMRTTITSPRMGGAFADQTRAYLDQREGGAERQLDAGTAAQILQEAGGDKERARELARSRGYRF